MVSGMATSEAPKHGASFVFARITSSVPSLEFGSSTRYSTPSSVISMVSGVA